MLATHYSCADPTAIGSYLVLPGSCAHRRVHLTLSAGMQISAALGYPPCSISRPVRLWLICSHGLRDDRVRCTHDWVSTPISWMLVDSDAGLICVRRYSELPILVQSKEEWLSIAAGPHSSRGRIANQLVRIIHRGFALFCTCTLKFVCLSTSWYWTDFIGRQDILECVTLKHEANP